MFCYNSTTCNIERKDLQTTRRFSTWSLYRYLRPTFVNKKAQTLFQGWFVFFFTSIQDVSSEPSYVKWLSRPRPPNSPVGSLDLQGLEGPGQEDEQVQQPLQLPAVGSGAAGKHEQYGTVFCGDESRFSGVIGIPCLGLLLTL